MKNRLAVCAGAGGRSSLAILLLAALGICGFQSTAHADPADIVLRPSAATLVNGNWASAASTGAAGGRSMTSVDLGWSSVNAPLATPSNFFEMTFDAPAATSYRIWLRLRAAGNSKWNDAVWVQFSDAMTAGAAAYRIGTTAGLMVNLERCSGCGTSGWGWQNSAYWLTQSTVVTFASSGKHTIRVQTREDGVEVDQIVLSPATFLSNAPGPILNDATIVPIPAPAPAPAPTPAPMPATTPYSGVPIALPGIVDAAHFDNGVAGSAYSDTSPGNAGGVFRTTDVDVQAASVGGYNVGWTAPGEWLKYTVNVGAPGTYNVQVQVASLAATSVAVAFGNASATTLPVAATGGWQAWRTVSVPVTLVAGQQVLTVTFPVGAVNLRSVSVTTAAAPPPPPPPPPPSGTTLMATSPSELHAALTAANPGDTILLQAGVTFVGNFELPRKSGTSTAYITLRSSAPDAALPGPGTRMTPAYAAQLPKLRSPNSMSPIYTAPGAHHYRLQFLEVLGNPQGAGTLVDLGDGSSQQNTLDLVPHNLILDRMYIHGDPIVGQKRGIGLNSASTQVLNSHVSDIKSSVQDSQAVAGWNGPGPFLISNNYLEASGENVMFGGADPRIHGLVPSDITLSRNLLSKPLAWRSTGWIVKNLLELKNAQRVVIDANVFENNWLAAQSGYAILLKSVNQDGTAPWSVVQDVRFTNNVVRHVSSAINILGRETTFPALEANRITIRNNVFEDVSVAYGGIGVFLHVVGGSEITVDHNTVFNDNAVTVAADARPSAGFVFTNNILIDRGSAVRGSGATAGNDTIAKYFPGSKFFGGIFAGSNPAQYPVANFYPPSLDAVGFVNVAQGQYRLAATSIYRGGATDGTDPGCNFDLLNAAHGVTRW